MSTHAPPLSRRVKTLRIARACVGEYKCWRTKIKPAIFAVQGRCTKIKPTTGLRFSRFRTFQLLRIDHRKFKLREVFEGARCTEIKPRAPPGVSPLVDAVECDRVKSLFTPASWLLAGSDRVKSLSEPTSFLPAGLTHTLISLVPTPVSAAPKSLFVKSWSSYRQSTRARSA